MMNKQYARTCYTSGIDITALTEYPIIDWEDGLFYILDDVGEKRGCWPIGCAHIGDNNWEIIEVKESEAMNSILVGKDAQKVAVMDWAEEMRARGWWVDVNTRRHCDYVIAFCGNGSASRKLEARGGDMIAALIELMKGWDSIYGEAAELDREWKAFRAGLGDDAAANIEFGDNECIAVATTSGGEFLQYAGKNEAASKRGLMKAWAAINNE